MRNKAVDMPTRQDLDELMIAGQSRSIEHLKTRIAQLEAALTKVHGIVAEYWAPCMGSIEVLLTCREAIGESAKNWRPKLTAETFDEHK